MGYDTGERYLKEINHVSILESIDEVFDGATSLLTENAVMYGSSVTSVIAGLPIVGDLDVAVSNQEYMKLCQSFASSVKWVQIQGKNIPESKPRLKQKYSFSDSLPSVSAGPPSNSNPYAGAKHLPINDVVAFHTVNGACVQIVQSSTMTGDILEDALEVVRKVDFAFCGMAVDRWGRMLETIPNAYSDCLERLIRIHSYQQYLKRGWSLTFSIDQAMINLARAKTEYAKRPKKKTNRQSKKTISGFRLKKMTKKGIVIETTDAFIKNIGQGTNTRDVVRHFASETRGIKINSVTNKFGRMEFWSPGGSEKFTISKAKAIIRDVDDYYRQRYAKAYDRMRQQTKAAKFGKMYGGKSSGYGGFVSTGSFKTTKDGMEVNGSSYGWSSEASNSTS